MLRFFPVDYLLSRAQRATRLAGVGNQACRTCSAGRPQPRKASARVPSYLLTYTMTARLKSQREVRIKVLHKRPASIGSEDKVQNGRYATESRPRSFSATLIGRR